jgi:hypothetical protein
LFETCWYIGQTYGKQDYTNELLVYGACGGETVNGIDEPFSGNGHKLDGSVNGWFAITLNGRTTVTTANSAIVMYKLS